MSVTWEISDGSPNFWLADSIVVRDTANDAGFVATNPDPPGPFVPPTQGTTCWVWVRLARFGNFVDGENQVGQLRLFVGRAGPHFAAEDYANYTVGVNLDLLDPPIPPTPWGNVEWTAQLTGKKVVPIRMRPTPVTWGMQYVMDQDTTITPAAGGYRWFRFEWEGHRIPPRSENVGWHTCLLAYLHDDRAPFPGTGSAYVESYNNFAQNNFGVAAKRGAVKRRVVLGNSSSRERRLGVRVWAEGPAAEGSRIRLRFVGSQPNLARLHFADSFASELCIPRPTSAMSPAGEVGHPELRAVPESWGVKCEGGTLHLAPRDAGFVMPVTPGEQLEAELSVMPGQGGDSVTVHVVEFDSRGVMPGGVSFKVLAQ